MSAVTKAYHRYSCLWSACPACSVTSASDAEDELVEQQLVLLAAMISVETTAWSLQHWPQQNPLSGLSSSALVPPDG